MSGHQTTDEKRAAIIEALGHLHDWHPLLLPVHQSVTPPDMTPRPPSHEEHEHEEILWLRICLATERRYRNVLEALDVLADLHPRWYYAVYHTHVEPCGWWHPNERVFLAADGVRWLAECCRGDVSCPRMMRVTVSKQVLPVAKELRSEGKSYRAIARELRVSKSTVHYALKGR